mgnify:CR=1 FL=1
MYVGGYSELSNDSAKEFVEQAVNEGKTIKPWSESTVRRVSAYLTGTLADYSLLEKGSVSTRNIMRYHISPVISAYLAYDLHFMGLGDESAVRHEDWALFGMSEDDVRNELKQVSLKGHFLIQAAGKLIRISWKYADWEEFINALT